MILWFPGIQILFPLDKKPAQENFLGIQGQAQDYQVFMEDNVQKSVSPDPDIRIELKQRRKSRIRWAFAYKCFGFGAAIYVII